MIRRHSHITTHHKASKTHSGSVAARQTVAGWRTHMGPFVWKLQLAIGKA
eukprot:SAG11_NODE_19781_length_459_cov_0.563889_1_plen_49_part_01